MRAKLTTTALTLTLIVPGLALAQQQSGTANPPPAAAAPGASGMSTSPAVGTTSPSTTHDAMGTTGTHMEGASTSAGDTGTMSNTSPGTTTTVADNPLYNMKGEQIVGQNLYGPNGEEIGEVDNVVMSQDGKQAAAVVGVGGFLGIGERKVTIPLDQLRMGADSKLTTSMTKDQISSMQPYEESGWSKLDPSRTVRDWMNR